MIKSRITDESRTIVDMMNKKDINYKITDEQIQDIARLNRISLHKCAALVLAIDPKLIKTSGADGYYCTPYIDGRNIPKLKEISASFNRVFEMLSNEWPLLTPLKPTEFINWVDTLELVLEDRVRESLEHFIERRQGATSNQNPNEASPRLDTQERETLLTIIAAMSSAKYGWHPDKRNKAVSAIEADIQKMNMQRISDDTIRAKLKAASELVPQSFFKK